MFQPQTAIQPIHTRVARYGVKATVYGGPGTGKTPLLLTAPNALHAFSEPGLLSIRKSDQPSVLLTNVRDMKDYADWIVGSNEARHFQTFTFDSVSQMAEIALREAKGGKNKNGQAWYGMMSDDIQYILERLYYGQGFHCVMLAKEGNVTVDGITKYRPYFPGQDLNIKTPHLFDSTWRLEWMQYNNQLVRAIRTREGTMAFARDRSGNLAEFEPPDLTYLINKAMQ